MTRTAAIAHAREVDTRIAQAYDAYHEANDELKSLVKSVKRTEKDVANYWGLSSNLENLKAKLQANIAKREELKLRVAALHTQARELDAREYEGWPRFFLVQHIHSSNHCSSFRATTRVGWLPDVSGLTEAEAVAQHGAALCTICFPSAPTELTTKPVDPTVCAGEADPEKPSRRGYYTGNWATCAECGAQPTLTASGKLRKHKRAS